MRIYTPSGIEMDITIDEKGDIYVNSNVPDRNYSNDAELLKGIYEDMTEILDVAHALDEGTYQGFSENIIALHPVHPSIKAATGKGGKKTANKKDLTQKTKGKGNTNKKASPGVAPPDQKVIKIPGGRYLTISDNATIEVFGENEIETTGKAKVKVDPKAAKAFTIDGKRYVAGFDKTGKFEGYYLSTGMETKFVPEPILYKNKVDDKFINKLLEITYSLRQDPNKLMAVMAQETGETFDPTIKGGSAVGLLQFTGAAIKQLNNENNTNYTKDDILKMTAEEQLDLVKKYYNGRILRNKTLKTVEDYAVANFAPADVGKGPNNIIYTKNTKDKNKIKDYNKNAPLDVDKDGNITNAEVGAAYKAKYVKK